MWWRDAVVYQIYPRSFADGNGDGIGDLAGLRSRLEHLAWLGIDAIWLSPIFRSPMADFGYDVADHCDIDPVFGTLADADALVAEAHDLGIRVLLDWVPNHTSDQHPWFRERPDYYVWRDGGPDGGPPNNWVRAFPFPPALPAWTRDEATGRWYLHLFLPEQPDVDWENPALEAAMHDVLRFWLDRGVDGFRADVIHCIGKDPTLPDDPPDVAGIPHCALNRQARTHDLLRGIRAVLDEYAPAGERVMVGEVAIAGPGITEHTATYAGPDLLHLAFDFTPLHARWGEPARWRSRIARIDGAYADADDRWPTWVLSNHDNPRQRTRYGGTEAAARAAAMLLLGVRGTPFLYAGEELGLTDADVPPERVVDPGGRDGCRAPIPWSCDDGHGWGREPWLPFPPNADTRSVEAQRADPTSVLCLYRRLLAARKASAALRRGEQRLLDVHDDVVAWERVEPESGDRRVVLVSMGEKDVRVPDVVGDGLVLEVASDGSGDGAPFDGVLRAGHALWLRPA
jgi:alpha-glucosidase